VLHNNVLEVSIRTNRKLPRVNEDKDEDKLNFEWIAAFPTDAILRVSNVFYNAKISHLENGR